MPETRARAVIPFVDAAPAFASFHSLMQRADDSLHSFVLLDVDQLGWINAEHGRHVGDAVLRRMVDVVRLWTNPPVSSGYWAGDQVVVVLPDVDRTSGVLMISGLLTRVSTTDDTLPPGLRPSASAGGTTCRPGATGPLAVANAAAALRDAKRHRGSVCWS